MHQRSQAFCLGQRKRGPSLGGVISSRGTRIPAQRRFEQARIVAGEPDDLAHDHPAELGVQLQSGRHALVVPAPQQLIIDRGVNAGSECVQLLV